MRAVVPTDEGVVELNWLLLPTCVGHNTRLKQSLEKKIQPLIEGQPLTEELLDRAHSLVIEEIARQFPHLSGLDEYLDSLKLVFPSGR